MNEQYKTKVQQLSDELTRLEQQNDDKAAIMNCRDDFFAAKREMVLWDKSNKKTQVNAHSLSRICGKFHLDICIQLLELD